MSATETTVLPPHLVEERKELKQRHALIRRRLNKLLRHQVDGTYVGRSQLNPLERARYDEVTWTKTQLTDKDHIRRARQGLRRFVKTALIDIEDAAAKELLFTYRRKDLDALYARRHEPMTDGLMRFKQR